MPLGTHAWEAVTAEEAPFDGIDGGSLHRALSTWDSQRDRWVFHASGQVASYDPVSRTWERHADVGVIPWATNGITYIPQQDVLMVVGSQASDTAFYSFDADTWERVDGGQEVFEPEGRFHYLAYDGATNAVVMVSKGNTGFYRWQCTAQ